MRILERGCGNAYFVVKMYHFERSLIITMIKVASTQTGHGSR